MFGGKVQEGSSGGLENGNYIFTVTGAICGWNVRQTDKGETRSLAMRFTFRDDDGGEAESKVINLPFDPDRGGFYKSGKAAFYPLIEAMLGRPLNYETDEITFAMEYAESPEQIPALFQKGERPEKVTSLRVGGVELLNGKRRVRLKVSDGEPFQGKATKSHSYSADEFVPTKRAGAAPKPAPAQAEAEPVV